MCTVPQDETSFLTVQARRLRDAATWRDVSGSAVLTVDGVLDDVRAGDVLRIWATLRLGWTIRESRISQPWSGASGVCAGFMCGTPTVLFAWGRFVGRVG